MIDVYGHLRRMEEGRRIPKAVSELRPNGSLEERGNVGNKWSDCMQALIQVEDAAGRHKF